MFEVRYHPRVPIQGGRVPIVSGHPVHIYIYTYISAYLSIYLDSEAPRSECSHLNDRLNCVELLGFFHWAPPNFKR